MTDLLPEYERLVNQAVELLGSKRAVSRWLGLSDHGQLQYRLEHPNTIRREQVIALESLVSRVQYRPKYPAHISLCKCGGIFEHVKNRHEMGQHWQVMKCSKCKRALMRELAKDESGP